MLKITETNVTIMVNSMDKAIQFYQDIGLTLKNRWGDHYAMMETKGLTIGLHPSNGPTESSKNISIGFMVDDINEAKTLLDKQGIAYKAEDDGKSGKYLHFKDLDGTILYFTQPSWR
jgi:catechol 2,3-dioxygenase-like lactoylglutathione lyase family enzyme